MSFPALPTTRAASAPGTALIIKPTTETRANQTLALDAVLKRSIKAGEVWLCVWNLVVDCSTDGGIQVGVSAPDGASGVVMGVDAVTGANGILPVDGEYGTAAFGAAVTYQTSSTESHIQVRAVIYSPIAGTMGLLWAQHATDATTTKIHAGSSLACTRL